MITTQWSANKELYEIETIGPVELTLSQKREFCIMLRDMFCVLRYLSDSYFEPSCFPDTGARSHLPKDLDQYNYEEYLHRLGTFAHTIPEILFDKIFVFSLIRDLDQIDLDIDNFGYWAIRAMDILDIKVPERREFLKRNGYRWQGFDLSYKDISMEKRKIEEKQQMALAETFKSKLMDDIYRDITLWDWLKFRINGRKTVRSCR